MKWKRTLASVLTAAMVVTSLPTALAVQDENRPATRAEVCDMLLEAADDYNPGVQASDIMQGYPDGELHEDNPVTRAEALVMLQRAFDGLPAPTGDN